MAPPANTADAVLKRWYQKDSNADPPEYILKARSTTTDEGRRMSRTVSSAIAAKKDELTTDQWQKDLDIIACHASSGSGGRQSFDDALQPSFDMPMTHWKLHETILGDTDTETNTFVIDRKLKDLPEDVSQDFMLPAYIDIRDGKQDGLAESRMKRIRAQGIDLAVSPMDKLEANIPWQDKVGVDRSRHEHKKYLEDIKIAINDRVRKAIDEAAKHADSLDYDPSLREASRHIAYAKTTAANIPEIISQPSSPAKNKKEEPAGVVDKIVMMVKEKKSQVIVLHGVSGCGKSTTISKVSLKTSEWVTEIGGVQIVRFIGTTTWCSDVRAMLLHLCRHISRAYGKSEIDIPRDYLGIVKAFGECLALATDDKPLVLLLDGLDRLGNADMAQELFWLPKSLPPHSYLVTSTTKPEKMRILYPEAKYIEIALWKPDQSEASIVSWLRHSNRHLTAKQLGVVRKALSHGKTQLTALYIKLIYETTRHWKSFTPITDNMLGDSVQDILTNTFEFVENKFGKVAVSHALGYLSISQEGLSSLEMDDLMSCDDEALNEIFPQGPPEGFTEKVRRIPPNWWLNLAFDLKHLVNNQISGEVIVYVWNHQLVKKAAFERYVKSDAVKVELHSALADYFCGKWAGGALKPYTDASGSTILASRLVAEQAVMFPPKSTRGFSRNASLEGNFIRRVHLNSRRLLALPYHLIHANRVQELIHDYLLCLDWIFPTVQSTSLHDVLQYFTFCGSRVEDSHSLRLVASALKDSYKHVLDTDPRQIAGQVVGRLFPYEGDEDFPGVQQFLENCRNDFHSSEIYGAMIGGAELIPAPGWLCLPLAGNPLEMRFTAHKNSINCIAVSPDSSLATTGSVNGVVKVWKMDNGQEIASFKHNTSVTAVGFLNINVIVVGMVDGSAKWWKIDTLSEFASTHDHTAEIKVVKMSVDKQNLITGCSGGVVKIRNVSTRRLSESVKKGVVTLNLKTPVLALATTITHIFTSSKEGVTQWDLKNGKKVADLKTEKPNSSPVMDMGVTPDGLWVYTICENGKVDKIDVANKKVVEGFESEAGDWLIFVTVAPDASIAAASMPDGAVKIFELETGEDVNYLFGEEFAECIAFAPNGTFLVTGTKEAYTVDKWNIMIPMPPPQFRGHGAAITCLACTPDGKRSITSGRDMPTKMIVWDMETTDACFFFKKHTDEVRSVAITADGVHAISLSASTIMKWTVEDGTLISTIDSLEVHGYLDFLSITSDGSRAAFATPQGFVGWADLETGLTGGSSCCDNISCLAICNNGTEAIYGGPEGLNHIDLTDNSEIKRFVGSADPVSVAVGGNDEFVLGGLRENLRKWSLKDGGVQNTLRLHSGEVIEVNVMRDSKYAIAASSDLTISIWNLGSATNVGSLTMDKEVCHTVKHLSCSADPKNLVVVCGCKSGMLGKMHLLMPPDEKASLQFALFPSGSRSLLHIDAPPSPKSHRAQSMAFGSGFSRSETMTAGFDADRQFYFATDTAIGVLNGDMSVSLSGYLRTVRVHVICSLDDTVTERNFLIEMVLPSLQSYAHTRNVELQLHVDWNIDDDKLLANRVFNEDFRDFQLAETKSAKRGVFIVLLTQKYGIRGFPVHITEDQYQMFMSGTKKSGCSIS